MMYYEDVYQFIERSGMKSDKYIQGKKRVMFKEKSIALDLETTNMKEGDKKISFAYCCTLSYNYVVLITRSIDQLVNALLIIKKEVGLDDQNKMIIYIHNMSFDFQFFRKYMSFSNVFSTGKRRPISAETCGSLSGFVFKDMFILAHMKLEDVAKNLTSHNIRKVEGFDYSKIRHSTTDLTDHEIEYIINDVLIINAYIEEQTEIYGNICNIPMTNTARVRKYCKDKCLKIDDKGKIHNMKYYKMIHNLTIDKEEIEDIRETCGGGFVGMNSIFFDETIHNTASFDRTSAYIYELFTKEFPMSKGKKVVIRNIETFKKLLDDCLLIFPIEIFGIKQKDDIFCGYIQNSSCFDVSDDVVISNGKIEKCSHLCTTITSVDFDIIMKNYEIDAFNVPYVWAYEKGKIPKELIDVAIELFKDKTELKGVEGKEALYNVKKEMLNSIYGMIATNPFKEVIKYSDGWIENEDDDDIDEYIDSDLLDKYNKKFDRITSYSWAPFITAYARSTLWNVIRNLGIDFIYSDTDSVKFMNYKSKRWIFDDEFDKVINELCNACEYYRIDPENVIIKKGDDFKILGEWCFEGISERFKTLGHKIYIEEKNGLIKATIAGCNKKKVSDYLTENIDKAFEMFTNGMIINSNYCGSVCTYYFDDSVKGTVKDYKGKTGKYEADCYVYIEPSDFSINTDQKVKMISHIIEQICSGIYDQFWIE